MQDSIFTQIIKRELPGEILFEDEFLFVILTIMPHHPGHSLVIPKKQVDKLYELDVQVYQRVMDVAQKLANMLDELYSPKRVGMSVEGLAVPHAHVHLIPINNIGDMDHDRARPATPDELKKEGDKIREAIRKGEKL